MNQTNAKKNRTYNSMFLAMIAIMVLLLVLSILSASLIAGQNAVADAKKAVLGTETSTPEGETPDENVFSPATLTFDNVDYVVIDEFDTLSVTAKEGVYLLKCKNGTSYSFFENLCDYFCEDRLALLPHPAKIKDGKLCLPLSNVSKDFSSEEAVLTAALPAAADHNPRLPEDVSVANYFEAVTKTPEFTVDLDEYETYMNPSDRDAFLVLANATHSLGKDFVPQNLVAVERARYAEDIYKAKLQEPAAKALDAFLREAYACGFNDVTVTSGYRSYADQENRFNTKVSSLRSSYATLEEAQAAAATVIQWPGKSEHQTGLACDMHNLAAADVSFEDQPAATWLKEHAHNFGFILRYPKDKTNITGISFEPWHFRYVGRYHATRMSLLNLTLEEYTAFLSLDKEAA